MALKIIFEKQPTYGKRNKLNPNYFWFKYGERRVIEHVNYAIVLSWAPSGHLLAVARGGRYFICGDGDPRKFKPKRLVGLGDGVTKDSLQLLEMLYPAYKEIRADLLLLKEMIASGPDLDNDYDVLLSLCQQAKEINNEQERSLQASKYNTSGNPASIP